MEDRQAIDIERVETELRRWIHASGGLSFDPYDGLACSAPWSLVRRWHLGARLWMQAIKRSPINLRPLFGIHPQLMAKTLSDLAAAEILRHRLGAAGALQEARAHLERLRDLACTGYSGGCWAMPMHYVSRYVDCPPGDPNLFWTLNAAVSFLEAWELEGRAEDLRTARSAVEFMLRDLGWVDEGERGVWLRYYLDHEAVVYNVTALGGALLERVAACTQEPELAALGDRALRFVVNHQNADGSWFYARGPQGGWVDGFHTGYVLEALLQAVCMRRRAGRDTEDIEPSLRRGIDFYVRALFTPEALPRYTADRLYPIEVQNCAQAVQTLARLCWYDPAHLAQAERAARAVMSALYRRTRSGPEGAGYFRMSRGRWLVNSVPMLRWGQAPMLLAFESLLAARRGMPPSWELPAPARAAHN